jgi:Amidase
LFLGASLIAPSVNLISGVNDVQPDCTQAPVQFNPRNSFVKVTLRDLALGRDRHRRAYQAPHYNQFGRGAELLRSYRRGQSASECHCAYGGRQRPAGSKGGRRSVEEQRAHGPLHGVPVTIKLNVDVKGEATTNGVVANRNLIAPEDSAVVANLRKAGAINLGRTDTPSFSHRWFTENPLHGRTLKVGGDGDWIAVPPEKIERDRESPDGRTTSAAGVSGFTSLATSSSCFALFLGQALDRSLVRPLTWGKSGHRMFDG